eukprot:TRINITY_DN8038_c0_g1_i1.p1 TRINITY_DN8038_c0_g1~~TRINITY_DN8038_c0_g1_i1.p1  ORF type:complete len:265 (-),score=64.55 TRINITY_DN8038_c0_g1_i1:102-896(-)
MKLYRFLLISRRLFIVVPALFSLRDSSVGKMLKDEEVFSELQFVDGTQIHLAHKTGAPIGSASAKAAQPKAPQNISAGGFGMLNEMGYSNGDANPTAVNAFMNDPLMKMMMEQMTSNPELMKQMMKSNPQIQEAIKEHPELEHYMSNPANFANMLNDPQVIGSTINMMNRMNINSASTMQGSRASFPLPGKVEEKKEESVQQQPAKVQPVQSGISQAMKDDLLRQLFDLGFTNKEVNLEILESVGWDLAEAIALLQVMQEDGNA